MDDYEKNRNYWKYLKAKLKSEDNELGSITTQFKLVAPDGKKRLTNVMNYKQIIELAKNFPAKEANRFIEWFTISEESIDGKSKNKAYALWNSSFYENFEIGTIKGLQQIHAYLFGGLYDHAGQIRQKNIAKGGLHFVTFEFLNQSLKDVENMKDDKFLDIIKKYVELNIVHPFMEGNGRSMRIWLDLLLKKKIGKCIDWSKVDKKKYLNAMKESVVDDRKIVILLEEALTKKINDREIFMKGIDYSYYYEES